MRRRLDGPRAEYGARQAALLGALVANADLPPGFDVERAHLARHALVRKRARAVARAWPALVASLGRSFGQSFAVYAQQNPATRDPDAVADGLGFHRSLCGNERLDERAVRELLGARARYAVRDGRARPRRMPFVAAARGAGRRWLLVVYVPPLRPRLLSGP